MKSVAFLQTSLPTEKDPGGGAQRFFIDIFASYKLRKNAPFRLFFLTDHVSAAAIKRRNSFGHCVADILPIRSPSNRLHDMVANTHLLLKIIFKRIRLIHITQYYHVTHYKRLRFLQKLPAFIRPKLVINWVHCNFPYEYSDPSHYNYNDFHHRFDPLFNNIRLDGIFSWYELTKRFLEEKQLVKHKPFIYPIATYCCNTQQFKPASRKENEIVWAARLTKQKQPVMFVDAVHWIHANDPKAIKDWKFTLCGSGGEENTVRRRIEKLGLGKVIEFRTDVSDMSAIFSRSKCFVSTQDYENFTSLSMNEAMAAGNALIARNVGQTSLYVEDGRNGFLTEEDTAAGVGKAILKYLAHPELHQQMSAHSLSLTANTHTEENFMNQLDQFWSQLLKSN